jgi:hypothetical protein
MPEPPRLAKRQVGQGTSRPLLVSAKKERLVDNNYLISYFFSSPNLM